MAATGDEGDLVLLTANPRVPFTFLQQLLQKTHSPTGVAYRFYDGCEIACLTNKMYLCLGAGNRRVKPSAVRESAFLNSNDNPWLAGKPCARTSQGSRLKLRL